MPASESPQLVSILPRIELYSTVRPSSCPIKGSLRANKHEPRRTSIALRPLEIHRCRCRFVRNGTWKRFGSTIAGSWFNSPVVSYGEVCDGWNGFEKVQVLVLRRYSIDIVAIYWFRKNLLAMQWLRKLLLTHHCIYHNCCILINSVEICSHFVSFSNTFIEVEKFDIW